MKQQLLFQLPKVLKSFGGQRPFIGQRKIARPLNCKNPIHLVLRSNARQFLRQQLFVEYYLRKFSKKFQVKIYEQATVSNHIHLIIKVSQKSQYIQFIRAVTGSLAKTLKIKWACRPFTRVITWGRDLQAARKYVIQNTLEAFGLIPYQPRGSRAGP